MSTPPSAASIAAIARLLDDCKTLPDIREVIKYLQSNDNTDTADNTTAGHHREKARRVASGRRVFVCQSRERADRIFESMEQIRRGSEERKTRSAEVDKMWEMESQENDGQKDGQIGEQKDEQEDEQK